MTLTCTTATWLFVFGELAQAVGVLAVLADYWFLGTCGGVGLELFWGEAAVALLAGFGPVALLLKS